LGGTFAFGGASVLGGEVGEEVAEFSFGEAGREVGGHGGGGGEGKVFDVVHLEQVEDAGGVDELEGVVTAILSDAAEGLAVFENDGGGFVAEVVEVFGGFDDGFADDGEGTASAYVTEIRAHAAALTANGMAVAAAGFRAPVDGLAGGGVAGDGVRTGGAGEGMNERDEVPGLVIGEFGGGHIGAGDAFADDLKDGVVAEGVPEGAADEVGSASAAAAIGAMAAGTGAHEEFGAGGDGDGVADGGVVGVAEVAPVLG